VIWKLRESIASTKTDDSPLSLLPSAFDPSLPWSLQFIPKLSYFRKEVERIRQEEARARADAEERMRLLEQKNREMEERLRAAELKAFILRIFMNSSNLLMLV